MAFSLFKSKEFIARSVNLSKASSVLHELRVPDPRTVQTLGGPKQPQQTQAALMGLAYFSHTRLLEGKPFTISVRNGPIKLVCDKCL